MSEAQRSKKVTGVSKVSRVSKVTKVLTEEISKTYLIAQLPETLAITGFTGGGGTKHLRPAERLDFAKNGNIIYINHFVIPQRIASRGTSEADLRTDGAKRVRIANGTSRLVRKHYRRDSVSVEQIQDARDEQQSTEMSNFRCCCERCRLSRAIFERNTPQSLPCGISNEEHKLFLTCGTCAAKK